MYGKILREEKRRECFFAGSSLLHVTIKALDTKWQIPSRKTDLIYNPNRDSKSACFAVPWPTMSVKNCLSDKNTVALISNILIWMWLGSFIGLVDIYKAPFVNESTDICPIFLLGHSKDIFNIQQVLASSTTLITTRRMVITYICKRLVAPEILHILFTFHLSQTIVSCCIRFLHNVIMIWLRKGT